MIQPAEEWHLSTSRLGRRVLLFDKLASTNSQASVLAEDRANEGIVVVAKEQTAGRGQHGRSWHSPSGAGVWMSLVLFPPAELRRPVILAAWAANAVCETLGQIAQLDGKIKWPNDVLINERKVSGILIEQGRGTVVGIGLNVNQTSEVLIQAGLPQATSIRALTNRTFPCDLVVRSLIEHLDQQYDRLCRGDLTTLETQWRSRTKLIGQRVLVECHHADHSGILRDLTWNAVSLETPNSVLFELLPETVKHINRPGV